MYRLALWLHGTPSPDFLWISSLCSLRCFYTQADEYHQSLTGFFMLGQISAASVVFPEKNLWHTCEQQHLFSLA